MSRSSRFGWLLQLHVKRKPSARKRSQSSTTRCLLHREEVVVEQDVPHAEIGELPAQRHDVLDAVKAAALARRGAVAERARERTAARRDDARDRRVAIVEDDRLEAVRELRQQIPRRQRQAIELVAVEIGRARIRAYAARPCDGRGRRPAAAPPRSPAARSGRRTSARPPRRCRSRSRGRDRACAPAPRSRAARRP